MQRRALLVLPLLPTLATATAVRATAFPDRAIRMVVPFPAGGGSDITARAVAPRMAEILGQPVVVDNRSGANGVIGATSVAQSKPDGYTLLVAATSELALKPLLEADLPYNPARDFDPVVLLGVTPVVIAVHPSVRASTIGELITLARARPGQLNLANSGSGGLMHLTASLLALRTGIDVTQVSYRGAAPAVADTVAGTTQAVVSGLPPVLAQARQGRLRILAVTTPQRTAAAPEVPTLEESGVEGFDLSNAFGLVVPRGTPGHIVALLNGAANRALASDEVRRIFVANGADPVGSTVQVYADFIARERERLRAFVQATGLSMH